MNTKELRRHIKELEIDYLVEGQSRNNVNQYTPHQEMEAHKSRQARGKRNERLTAEEKVTSVSCGLLCTHILEKINELEIT